MGYVRASLVEGTASAIGTGNATLTDIVGKTSFSTLADGSTVHYAIQDVPNDAQYEFGLGTKTTVSGSPVLQRTAANVLGGSAGAGTLVNFAAATQILYIAFLGEVDVLPNVAADPSVASTGQLTYRTDLQAVRLYVGSWMTLGGSSSGVTSFNTRTGAVTLTSLDVTNALGDANIAYTDVANTFTAVPQTLKISDAATATITDILDLYHASSGSPAASFGLSEKAFLDSATVAKRLAHEWDTTWTTATDASRTSRIQGFVQDATAAREWIRAESNGTFPLVGVCGPVVANTMMTVYPSSDTNVGLAIKANSTTATDDLFQILDSTGAVRMSISYASNWTTLPVRVLLDNTGGVNATAPPLAFLNHITTGFGVNNSSGDFIVLSNGLQAITASSGGGSINMGNGFSFPVLQLRGVGCLQNGNDDTTQLIVGPGFTGLYFFNPQAGKWDKATGNLSIGYGATTGSARLHTRLSDSGTNTVPTVAIVSHASTGTPAAGFGAGVQFWLDSSTTADRKAAEIDGLWATATDASRKGQMTLSVWDTSQRECIRCDTDGTAGQVSFFGAGSYGGGDGVVFHTNATTNPTSNPTGGGIMYANAGAGTWRGSSGTITAFGPAGPHCGACGYDHWRAAYRNDTWGSYLYECGMCGKVYKKGPASVLDRLSPQERTLILTE